MFPDMDGADVDTTTPRRLARGAHDHVAAAVPLELSRLARAKRAYTTRFLDSFLAQTKAQLCLITDQGTAPCSGDIVLARVGEIGQHRRLEGPAGRRMTLYPGDEVFVAYGNRYAPDQFEAVVPGGLGRTQLVAAGGVAGSVLSQHAAMLPATDLHPVGLLADNDGRVTLARCAPLAAGWGVAAPGAGGPPTIAVVGTSMNSGKTTTVASLAKGLAAAGLHVAAGKVTGTGAGGDPGLFIDAGATHVLDFTDFGYPSTYLAPPEEIRSLLLGIHAALADQEPDVIVLEVADGMFQVETAALVGDPIFRDLVDSVVFAASEAMGAAGGLAALRALGVPVDAVSGLLTASPLATREARGALDVPVLTSEQLHDPEQASTLLPTRRQCHLPPLAQDDASVREQDDVAV